MYPVHNFVPGPKFTMKKKGKNKMKILVLNCGSSSLKYQLINMENEEVLASGK